MDINIFSALMRSEFLNTMAAVAVPAPYQQFTTIVPSTARIQDYAWMTPGPGISRYVGHRRLAQLDSIKYTIENLEFDGAMSVSTRDIEDDNIGGYRMRMSDLAEKAKDPFKSELVLKLLANGASSYCFDGSYFFATSHNLGGAGSVPAGFGGGGNALTYTASGSSDAAVHKFCVLFHGNKLKPLILQVRKEPKFMTDAGTPASEKAKKADFWLDMEAASGFAYWWDSIQVTITNTPSLTDLFTCIDGVRQTFRKFTLPVALPTDPAQRVHEQTLFNPTVATIVCSTTLEQLFNHLLGEERIGVSVGGSTAGFTNNIYQGSFGLVTTGHMDS